MTIQSESTRRAARRQLPVVRRLNQLAREFDDAARYYDRFSGAHNALLQNESRRSAAQLRLVAALVVNGTYSPALGAIWIRASWRIITAIGRANIS